MSSFIMRLSGFLAIQAAIAAVVWVRGQPDCQDHYLCAIYDKCRLLEQTPSPRILLVGGSNLAFGINSGRLEEALGVPVINLGLHAGLGLDFPLKLAEDHIRPGDVVVLSPEYQTLTAYTRGGDAQTIAMLLEQWPAGKRYFGAETGWKHFLDTEALWLAHQWVYRARHRRSSGTGDPVYSRSAFEQHGDVIGHYGRTADKVSQNEPLAAPAVGELDRALERLNQFAAHCHAAGARVYFAYPPFPQPTFEASREVIGALHRTLARSLHMPIVHRPDQTAFPLDAFFDTAYHLNESGVERRSSVLAASLQPRVAGIARQPSSDAMPLVR